MNSFLGDLRYTVRRARARIGFTVVAVLSLALGIGVNTAAFSLVNAIILRKTPMPQRDRVAEVYVTRDREITGPFSYPDYFDLRERSAGVSARSPYRASTPFRATCSSRCRWRSRRLVRIADRLAGT